MFLCQFDGFIKDAVTFAVQVVLNCNCTRDQQDKTTKIGSFLSLYMLLC